MIRTISIASLAALLAAAGAQATVVVNPTSADLVGPLTVNSTAASTKMRFSTNSWEMSLSPRTNTDNSGGANFLQYELSNQAAQLTASWNFVISYAAGQGYTYSVDRAGAPTPDGILTWRNDAAQTSTTANTLNVPGPVGVGATRSFNFIRLHARNTTGAGSISYSNLQFNGDATNFVTGSVSSSSGARSSIDGSGGAGFAYQDLLSDSDLSLSNWTLTGTFQSSNTTTGDSIRFEVDMFNAGFQFNVVPLPTASALSLAGVGILGLRRRRAAL